MTKPRALDLFCGAGGATKGLQNAGFHVTGVDINPQPRYCGDVFHQADALTFPLDEYDFIWASPPCQAFTTLRNLQRTQHGTKEYPNLIPETRERLLASGAHYAIENVEGAPLGESGYLIMLCGTMFGLQTPDGTAEIRRHRLFETSFWIPLRPACQHGTAPALGVYGEGARTGADDSRKRVVMSCVGLGSPRVWDPERGNRKRREVTGNTPQTNLVCNLVRRTYGVEDARAAMQIPWMTIAGLSQAIPPAYSEFIGRQVLGILSGNEDSPAGPETRFEDPADHRPRIR